jgi:hypothetical protein
MFWHISQTLDPDFDELGGELTYAQIADPLPEPDEDPPPYFARLYRRQYEQERYQRERKRRIALLAMRNEVQGMRTRLASTMARFYRATRNLNPMCNRCRPYNWHHTPGYWGTGQVDWYRECR